MIMAPDFVRCSPAPVGRASEFRPEHWAEVPEWSLVTTRPGEQAVYEPFQPIS